MNKATFDDWLSQKCEEDVKAKPQALSNFLLKRKQIAKSHYEDFASNQKESEPKTLVSTVNIAGASLQIEQIPSQHSESTGSILRHTSHIFTDFLLSDSIDLAGSTILELGCGTGVTGLALAQKLGCNIILTDREDVTPLATRNVELNNLADLVRVFELFWGKEDDINAILGEYGQVDCLLCGDLIYEAYEIDDVLISTIDALVADEGVVLFSFEIRRRWGMEAFFHKFGKLFCFECILEKERAFIFRAWKRTDEMWE